MITTLEEVKGSSSNTDEAHRITRSSKTSDGVTARLGRLPTCTPTLVHRLQLVEPVARLVGTSLFRARRLPRRLSRCGLARQDRFGLGHTYGFYAAFCALGLVFTNKYVIETKGLSLQQIELMLARNPEGSAVDGNSLESIVAETVETLGPAAASSKSWDEGKAKEENTASFSGREQGPERGREQDSASGEGLEGLEGLPVVYVEAVEDLKVAEERVVEREEEKRPYVTDNRGAKQSGETAVDEDAVEVPLEEKMSTW
eukprot:853678-Prorocentrum_minimum.AAC.1